jgi:hypothetical protein
VPAGIFPKLPEEGSLLMFRARGWGEGDTHPAVLGKGEGEVEGWGKREFPDLMHEGWLVNTVVQFNLAQGQFRHTGSKG